MELHIQIDRHETIKHRFAKSPQQQGTPQKAAQAQRGEILRQLGAFDEVPDPLKRFHRACLRNFRSLLVGEVRPAFTLERD